MDRKLKTLLKGAGLDSLMEIRGGAISAADMPLYLKSVESEKAIATAKTPEEKAALVAKSQQDRAAWQNTDSYKGVEKKAQQTKADYEKTPEGAKVAKERAAAEAKIAADAKAREASEKVAAEARAKAAAEAKTDGLVKLSAAIMEGAYNYAPDLNSYKLFGELGQYKGKENLGFGSSRSVTESPAGPTATPADFQFWYDRLSGDQRGFINGFWAGDYKILVDRHTNQTPEEFAKTQNAMEARLKNEYEKDPQFSNRSRLKDPKHLLRDKWSLILLQNSPYWKKAEQFVSKDPMYRNVMGKEQWAAVFKNNAAEWQERINDAQNPQVKASLISDFGEYQRLNASYETYVANENAKPPPPSYKGKADAEVSKGVAEEDVKFDKREQIKKIRDADLETEREVVQKLATLNGMKTGNPINDQEIDEALAYIKWGEELREQISVWELAAANKDMELQEYWSSIGEPDLIDVEAEVAKEKEQIQNRINDYKKSPQYVLDQIKKWGMLVIDIGVNFLPYILPFPIGNVIQLGYEAFAPVGSIYHTEGSFTQKLQAGLVNGAEQAVLGMIGLGRKGRRKYMKTLMESEGGGEMGQIRLIEDDSSSHHALHAQTPPPSQRRRRVRRQT